MADTRYAFHLSGRVEVHSDRMTDVHSDKMTAVRSDKKKEVHFEMIGSRRHLSYCSFHCMMALGLLRRKQL